MNAALIRDMASLWSVVMAVVVVVIVVVVVVLLVVVIVVIVVVVVVVVMVVCGRSCGCCRNSYANGSYDKTFMQFKFS